MTLEERMTAIEERIKALEGQILVTEHGDRVVVHHHVPTPEKADAIT